MLNITNILSPNKISPYVNKLINNGSKKNKKQPITKKNLL